MGLWLWYSTSLGWRLSFCRTKGRDTYARDQVKIEIPREPGHRRANKILHGYRRTTLVQSRSSSRKSQFRDKLDAAAQYPALHLAISPSLVKSLSKCAKHGTPMNMFAKDLGSVRCLYQESGRMFELGMPAPSNLLNPSPFFDSLPILHSLAVTMARQTE